MSNFTSLVKKNAHEIISFIVGLLFLLLVGTAIFFIARGVYLFFKPNDIYANNVDPSLVFGGSVYDSYDGQELEIGSNEYYENYIANFIKQDFPDFEDPSDLNDEYLISYGIWQAITLNNSQGIYQYDKKGNFKVPKGDVEKFAFYCFDFGRKIDHRTVDICGKFEYNIFNSCYTVSSSGTPSYLVPKVTKVEHNEEDGLITLTVDCYENSLLDSEQALDNSANFRKRVKIVLEDMSGDIESTEAVTTRYIFRSFSTVDDTKPEEAQ